MLSCMPILDEKDIMFMISTTTHPEYDYIGIYTQLCMMHLLCSKTELCAIDASIAMEHYFSIMQQQQL